MYSMKGIFRPLLCILLLLACLTARAQESLDKQNDLVDFFNLSSQEVKIDSVLPLFTYTKALGADYSDSIYTVSIVYPEFIDMSPADVQRLHQLTDKPLPELPDIEQYIGIARKKGTLYVAFVPLVFREGRYQKLVSFMLKVQATPLPSAANLSRTPFLAASTSKDRYASHSVLASGRWVKISVPTSGVYELTSDLISKAGFSNINKVKVYGYGGAMQPEKLTGDYLEQTDDLQEVPTCTVGSRRLFYAEGPVGWSSATATARTRNPYSTHGYYFLTENDDEPLTVAEQEFKAEHYPLPVDYHTLYEVDDYAWYHGGRNLYDSRLFGAGVSHSYQLAAPASAKGELTVVLSCDAPFVAEVTVNGTVVGTVTNANSPDRYSKAMTTTSTYAISEALAENNEVTIRQVSGGNVRLDYLSLRYDTPQPWPDLAAGSIPVPAYVYGITNQDHHADEAVDMVIVIPTSQKLLAQAERLKAFHEQHDSLRVRIVPADELFNEFSSGTPDANAYRRYMKMLYDRAETEADMPRYLLLFGDGAWDNRMLTSVWKDCSTDDFLLCYESENSFSETDCYVSDDYFCLLDDGEGASMLYSDKGDIAVGRFPARSDDEAQVLVDKTIGYVTNSYADAWQNTVGVMGDDGDSNHHMSDAEAVAKQLAKEHPALNIKKIYWDAYVRQSSSTGFSYPDVTQLIRQQMQRGALIMNYSGHGAPYILSHEQVVGLADFKLSNAQRLPLWLTASCDIMPFDGQEENIGETAIFNSKGGTIAFYGTTRTVYASYNRYMNLAFTRYVLASDNNGQRYTIGEAARLAKNLLMTSSGNDIGVDRTANKLQYTLLGDPALTLAMPTKQIVIDSIGGVAADKAEARMLVGKTVRVKGHVVDGSRFNGVVTLTVRDIETTITCKLNNQSEADTPFEFKDRLNTLYNGSDSVRNGQFALTFTLPKDISYAEGTGLITAYAVSNDRQQTAHGYSTNFTMGSEEITGDDGIGPSIYCYLNSSSFVNGGDVNPTPYFYAELSDKDGINVSGSGVGHDLELIVDGQMERTYVLNDYFQYDFGNYRSGNLGFSIPQLSYGSHKLLFRAWDVFNNSSVAELQFNVVKGLEPSIFSIDCTKNPAIDNTTFVVTHDRMASQVDVEIDVFDMSGRQLWKHRETGVPGSQSYTVSWDLATSGGHRLQTGVYLYRVQLSSDGSSQASKAKKLIIISNK